MGDKSRGVHGKFRIERTDGRSAEGEKHEFCRYFVLDLDHDDYAREALESYAAACRVAYPLLADDLDEMLKARPCGCRSLDCPHLNLLSDMGSVMEHKIALAGGEGE